jgi:hypothetical protein
MKKIGEYTVRGQMAESTEIRIQLFDGRFDTGYKVVDVRALSGDVGSTGDDGCVRVSTASIGAMPTSGDMIDFSDNRQIAWAGFDGVSNGFGSAPAVIDPDNLVVEDLFISGQHGGTDPINYIIFMEKYDISEWQGALAMVRATSQG